jgi:putative redox protein
MISKLKWIEGMQFDAVADGNHVAMDAKSPLGKNKAMTPKELVATGLGGCTAMDVVALLKKHKQAYETFEVEVDVTTSTGRTPSIFTEARVTFSATGPIDKDIFLESVKLSQTKYCGISEMLLKAFPIRYAIVLNGSQIGEGRSDFSGT